MSEKKHPEFTLLYRVTMGRGAYYMQALHLYREMTVEEKYKMIKITEKIAKFKDWDSLDKVNEIKSMYRKKKVIDEVLKKDGKGL